MLKPALIYKQVGLWSYPLNIPKHTPTQTHKHTDCTCRFDMVQRHPNVPDAVLARCSFPVIAL